MSPANIRIATARDLRILADGDTLNPEDDAKLSDKYTALHAMLLDADLVTWGLTENVPAKCEQPVIAMLCALSVNFSGLPAERRAELILIGALHNSPISLAERQLRKALAPAPISQPQPTDYF